MHHHDEKLHYQREIDTKFEFLEDELKIHRFNMEDLKWFKAHAANKLVKDMSPESTNHILHIAQQSPTYHPSWNHHSVIDKVDHFQNTQIRPKSRLEPKFEIRSKKILPIESN